MSVGCLEPQFYRIFLETFAEALPDAFLASQDLKLSVEDQHVTDLWPKMKLIFESAFKLYDRSYWEKVFEGA